MIIDKLPRSRATNGHELVDDLCAAILAEPARIDMNYWHLDLDKEQDIDELLDERDAEGPGDLDIPACNTVACAAGWTVILAGELPTQADLIDFEGSARRLLIGEEDGSLSHLAAKNALHRLFHTYRPESGNDQPEPGTLEYAQAVVDMLRDFQTKHADVLKARKLNLGGNA